MPAGDCPGAASGVGPVAAPGASPRRDGVAAAAFPRHAHSALAFAGLPGRTVGQPAAGVPLLRAGVARGPAAAHRVGRRPVAVVPRHQPGGGRRRPARDGHQQCAGRGRFVEPIPEQQQVGRTRCSISLVSIVFPLLLVLLGKKCCSPPPSHPPLCTKTELGEMLALNFGLTKSVGEQA